MYKTVNGEQAGVIISKWQYFPFTPDGSMEK